MKPRSYSILARALEEGIDCGWNRAHKHVDNPSEETIKETIFDGIMEAITEVFDFQESDVG